MILLPLFIAAAVAPPVCHPLESGSVLARDLAPYVPAFAKLPDHFLVGYIPETGSPKTFQGADLERIARNRGIELQDVDDVCLVRRLFTPQPDEIRAAIEKTLGISGLTIEILTPVDRPLPTGDLVFPRTGVQGTGTEVTWHGFVQSAEGTKFPLTVRAKVTAKLPRVFAETNLEARRPLQQDQLRVVTGDESPFDDDAVRDLAEAEGMILRTPSMKGTALRRSQLERPMDVAFGDLVRVDVFEGATHLMLEGRAENGGMKGSFITVRNLGSGHAFRAEVSGKDQVTVGGAWQ
jgi:flagella basal body P-ring formation protein FlgA